MLKHNLILILRNLWRRRIYSFVILLSLTVGFVCSGILVAFLVYETSTDKFHVKHDRIFQIFSDDPFQGKGHISYITKMFTDYMVSNYPEVEKVCQVADVPGAVVGKEGGPSQELTLLAADTTFFSLFDFALIIGRRNTCIAPGRIVLSREKALALFGRTNVIDQVLTLRMADSTLQLLVSAVLDAPRANSHLRFDAIVDPTVFAGKWYGGVTYALLQERNALRSFERKINRDARRPGLVGVGKSQYFFTSLTKSYFNSDNKRARC